MHDAIVAGHICLDVIPDLSALTGTELGALLRPGRLITVGPLTFSTGGAVSNTGIALNRLGICTRLMGKIGCDLLGGAVRDIVDQYGENLADSMITDPKVSTSYTIIVNAPGVDRVFLHCPDANDTFGAGDVDYEAVGRARLFHFGYPPLMRRMFVDDGEELIEMLRRAKATGVTTSLDMALPDPASEAGRADWRVIVSRALPFVDIFLPSIEECLMMMRPGLYAELIARSDRGDLLSFVSGSLLSDLSSELLGMGARIAGLKLGDRGLYLRTSSASSIESMGNARPRDAAQWADRELWGACFKAKLVGTTGAGDATIAGFLAALLRNTSPEDALTAAVAVGGCNVEAADALSGVREWDETWQRVRSGWGRHELIVDDPGWFYDTEHSLWRGPACG
ncbi:MAG: carbohydrate kinase family protein [Chloroflexi bacterium]|nr:carbohydrate kinase family protein [Chloroflexota bacterium]